ncbi:peptide chain release factor N(5)-glutamine methyltransferase [Marinicella meishanensis]|uniref:peptide chain release factor N(5)-glutamine methyltransferase n=1 Tax=Marinicella meishanensis TaxID=2873263 RepID=UPI001CBFFEB8|nr:peptide chain release factor N(5)-glutamine methyltransferase [Marinicella sp. NBU2979]
MHTVNEWLTQSIQRLSQPIAQPHDLRPNDLRTLLCHQLQCTTAWLFAHPDHPLSSADLQQLNAWRDQLLDGMPLAYLIGKQMFWDLDLAVNAATLIPRADTETVVETSIELLKDSAPEHILDLGTGSGALALALARVFPAAQVTATDRSSAALKTAQFNAQQNDIQNCQFILADWFSQVPERGFDLIVSNPPYIAANDPHLTALTHEPIEALVAAEDGLADFKTICEQAPAYLNAGAWLVFEHGWQQKTEVQALLRQAGLTDINSRADLAGHDRVSYGRQPSSG